MAEEFITDIIGQPAEPKTEAEMVAEIQVPVVEKSDEVVVVKGAEGAPDEVKTEGKVPAASVDDPIEVLAEQLGWRKDHTGDDTVDASTYILKSKDIQKSMGQHNKDLKDQLRGLSGSVDALQKHNESVYKSEVKKLTGEITSLKKERRAAIELADVDKVDELDKQIEGIQEDIDTSKVESKVPEVSDNPAYDTWVKDNQWYLTDPDMAAYANIIADQYGGAPLDRVYTLVRNKVQEVFPEKFDVAQAAEVKTAAVKAPVGPVSPVESSSAKVEGPTFTKADLTADQLQIMTQFVRQGIMTEKQYIDDIAKMQ